MAITAISSLKMENFQPTVESPAARCLSSTLEHKFQRSHVTKLMVLPACHGSNINRVLGTSERSYRGSL